jgi:hypothetical protein
VVASQVLAVWQAVGGSQVTPSQWETAGGVFGVGTTVRVCGRGTDVFSFAGVSGFLEGSIVPVLLFVRLDPASSAYPVRVAESSGFFHDCLLTTNLSLASSGFLSVSDAGCTIGLTSAVVCRRLD